MKMNLGTAMYGRSFTLRNASENGLGAPSSGPGAPGIFTGARGTLGYDEVRNYLVRKAFFSFL